MEITIVIIFVGMLWYSVGFCLAMIIHNAIMRSVVLEIWGKKARLRPVTNDSDWPFVSVMALGGPINVFGFFVAQPWKSYNES